MSDILDQQAALRFFSSLHSFAQDPAALDVAISSLSRVPKQDSPAGNVYKTNTLARSRMLEQQRKFCRAQPQFIAALTEYVPADIPITQGLICAPMDLDGKPVFKRHYVAYLSNKTNNGPDVETLADSSMSNPEQKRYLYSSGGGVYKTVHECTWLHEVICGMLVNSIHVQHATHALCTSKTIYMYMPRATSCLQALITTRYMEHDRLRMAGMLFFHICKGLYYLNSVLGLAHCDIKPGNILYDTLPNGSTIFKLCDLGSAMPLGHRGLFLGTVPYVAVEVVKTVLAAKTAYLETYMAITNKMDIWGLAVVMKEVISQVDITPYFTGEYSESAFNRCLVLHEQFINEHRAPEKAASTFLNIIYKLCFTEETTRPSAEALLQMFGQFHSFLQYVDVDTNTDIKIRDRRLIKDAVPINIRTKFVRFKDPEDNRCLVGQAVFKNIARTQGAMINLLRKHMQLSNVVNMMYKREDLDTTTNDGDRFLPLDDVPTLSEDRFVGDLPTSSVFHNQIRLIKQTGVQHNVAGFSQIVGNLLEPTISLHGDLINLYPIDPISTVRDLEWITPPGYYVQPITRLNCSGTGDKDQHKTHMVLKTGILTSIYNYTTGSVGSNFLKAGTFHGVTVYSNKKAHLMVLPLHCRSLAQIITMLNQMCKLPRSKYLMPVYGYMLQHMDDGGTLIIIACPGPFEGFLCSDSVAVKKPTKDQLKLLHGAAGTVHTKKFPLYIVSTLMLQSYQQRFVYSYPLCMLCVLGGFVKGMQSCNALEQMAWERNALRITPTYTPSPFNEGDFVPDLFPLQHPCLDGIITRVDVVAASTFLAK